MHYTIIYYVYADSIHIYYVYLYRGIGFWRWKIKRKKRKNNASADMTCLRTSVRHIIRATQFIFVVDRTEFTCAWSSPSLLHNIIRLFGRYKYLYRYWNKVLSVGRKCDYGDTGFLILVLHISGFCCVLICIYFVFK